MRRLSAVLLVLLLAAGCSEPPNKEINRAQGAVDAARAAGAEQYATEAFTAATSALQQSREAVDQRDYRLALSRAIDAYERAQDAAKLAADGKAKARSDAESAVSTVNAAALGLDARLKAAEAARVPARALTGPKRSAKEAAATLQKARASIAAGTYLEAIAEVKGLDARIRAAIEEVGAAAAAHNPRRPAAGR
ncbi:MAG: hypothetical protein ABI603_15375 [Acidobacteriota bacterium]